MERVKRFELSTSTLARLRSTPELHPHRNMQKMTNRHEVRRSIYKTPLKKQALLHI